MFGPKKKTIQLSICQSSCSVQGNPELTFGNSLSPMGDKDNDLGAASQTVLTGVRLRLQGSG